MNDNDLMPFGKHKGKKLIAVPDEYLLWLYENANSKQIFSPLLVYIYDNLASIRANIHHERDNNDQE